MSDVSTADLTEQLDRLGQAIDRLPDIGPQVVVIEGSVYGYCTRCCELPAEFGSEGDFLVTVAKKFSRQHAKCRPWPKGIPVKQYLKSLQNPAAKQEA